MRFSTILEKLIFCLFAFYLHNNTRSFLHDFIDFWILRLILKLDLDILI
jgi:uncharacterized PurR-regulated membrane protein YhhQ (DUF165 family)